MRRKAALMVLVAASWACAERGASPAAAHSRETEASSSADTRASTSGSRPPATAPSRPASSRPASDQGFEKSFAGAEGWAEHFDDPERDAWQKPDEVVRLLDLEPGHTVADVGAGTGYFLARLSKAVGPRGRVLGLDVEPDMVRYMAARIAREEVARAEARQVEPDDPGLEPNSVDRVLIVNTWHHISDRRGYAAKLARALTPGGAVVVVDFTMESPTGPPRHHRLSPAQVVEELEAGGLDAEILEETLPRQYVVVGHHRRSGA